MSRKNKRTPKSIWVAIGAIFLIILLIIWLTVADLTGDTDVAAFMSPMSPDFSSFKFPPPAPKRASARTATRRTASATPGWKCCDAGPTNGCW